MVSGFCCIHKLIRTLPADMKLFIYNESLNSHNFEEFGDSFRRHLSVFQELLKVLKISFHNKHRHATQPSAKILGNDLTSLRNYEVAHHSLLDCAAVGY